MGAAVVILAVLAALFAALATAASTAALVRLGTLERTVRVGFTDMLRELGGLQKQRTLAQHPSPAVPRAPEPPPPGAAPPPPPLGFLERAAEEQQRRQNVATPPDVLPIPHRVVPVTRDSQEPGAAARSDEEPDEDGATRVWEPGRYKVVQPDVAAAPPGEEPAPITPTSPSVRMKRRSP